MKTYFALFMISLFTSLVLTPLIRRLSERLGWIDEPRDDRRIHQKGVSRLGGVAIFFSVGAGMTTFYLISSYTHNNLDISWRQLFPIFVPAALILLLGVYDDLVEASVSFKFIGQLLAAMLFFWMGGRIGVLGIPFIGSVALPQVLSFALTLFWVIGITNAFNLIDGIDGLAAGTALFASLVLLISSLAFGVPLVIVVALVLSGALIGFLRYNFNPASIFLGDSGSLYIGFLLATLSVQGVQKASTAIVVAIPILAFGVPMMDTGITLARRFIGGQPLLKGDREHIHHMLLDRGWSQRRVVLVLYGISALLGFFALLFVGNYGGPTTGLLLFIIGSIVLFVVGRLRYHEMDEVRASMRRNLSERRMRAANNIRVRRAGRALSKASTMVEVFKGVLVMLESQEFVCATVQFSCTSESASQEQLLKEISGRPSVRNVELKDGQLCWTWERGDVTAEKVIGSGRYWSLRLPLKTERTDCGYINFYREFDAEPLRLDVNYLCGFFRQEIAQALERVSETRRLEVGARKTSVSAAVGN
ncbi:MAG TPA: MraY family glycosyltransferase [Pyrinomonadaceae bacterium]